MKTIFEGFGDKEVKPRKHETGKFAGFNEVQGGENGAGKGVDPYGDAAVKEKDTLDMSAGIAFSKAFLTKVDAMGTDMPKKNNKGQKTEKDDHFSVSTSKEVQGQIDPMGDFAGKSESYQSRH